jgi:hypothetical protein
MQPARDQTEELILAFIQSTTCLKITSLTHVKKNGVLQTLYYRAYFITKLALQNKKVRKLSIDRF